jgi:hypothetical protein
MIAYQVFGRGAPLAVVIAPAVSRGPQLGH